MSAREAIKAAFVRYLAFVSRIHQMRSCGIRIVWIMHDQSYENWDVPQGDCDLARGLIEVLAGSHGLKRMGEYNRTRVTAWDWSGVARSTAARYRACLDNVRGIDLRSVP